MLFIKHKNGSRKIYSHPNFSLVLLLYQCLLAVDNVETGLGNLNYLAALQVEYRAIESVIIFGYNSLYVGSALPREAEAV